MDFSEKGERPWGGSFRGMELCVVSGRKAGWEGRSLVRGELNEPSFPGVNARSITVL
jgi:hypothetical protein